MSNYDKLLPKRGFKIWVFAGILALVAVGFVLGLGDGFDLTWVLTMIMTCAMVGAVTFICYWRVPRFGLWIRRNFGRPPE